VIAEGLAALIGATDDLQVVALTGTAGETIEAASATQPDVILLDHFLPDRTGIEVIGELKATHPDTAVVMLTSATDETVLAEAFAAGAAGHLVKTEAAAQVLDAIRSAARGESFVSHATLQGVLRQAKSATRRSARQSPLTPRETEVIKLLAAGRRTSEIAEDLGLTIPTIRTYVQEILRKLGSRSRLQAVMRAVDLGIV
jgi:DNA-binding NarL/FixJ family response regulator